MLKELNHYFTVQSELQGQICEEIKEKKKVKKVCDKFNSFLQFFFFFQCIFRDGQLTRCVPAGRVTRIKSF